MTSRTQGFVLPVFASYLDVLAQRASQATTMIWGWQGQARRMGAPVKLLRQQPYVPFLFRAVDTAGLVSHVALSGLILHKTSAAYASLAPWLDEHRVERFAASPWGNRSTTFYVVTGGHKLAKPIPFEHLTLASEERPLSPGMLRGYAGIYLPDSLLPWYQSAGETWEGLDVPHLGAV